MLKMQRAPKVRPDLGRMPMTESITRILVPMDFSAPSDRALRYAATLAGRLGASVELFHVVEDPFMSGAWGSETYVPDIQQLLDGLIADASERLSTLKSSLADKNVPVTTRVERGRPAHTIVERANAGGFDLIVMGTHGRTGLSHLIMGSVAERVVRNASCPVLTVRGETRAADNPSPAVAEAVAS
jgi:nucleotide-binding universal stress UspA family protein